MKLRVNFRSLVNAISVTGVVALMLFVSSCSNSGITEEQMATYQKAVDIAEIQNVMSRHAWYYSSGQHERELEELFAMDQPDVCWGSESGWWVGSELLTEYYVDYFYTFRRTDLEAFAKKHPEVEVTDENLGAGTSMFHTNTTPIIEVAADGQTAKGMWYSLGQVTQTPGGDQTPQNMWERYGVDFIKVDGEWKIWHFMVNTDLSWREGTGSWIMEGGMGAPDGDQGGPAPEEEVDPGQIAPGKSSSAPSANVPPAEPEVRGGNSYDPPAESTLMPIPVAYDTFDNTFTYGPPRDATWE